MADDKKDTVHEKTERQSPDVPVKNEKQRGYGWEELNSDEIFAKPTTSETGRPKKPSESPNASVAEEGE